MADPAQVLLITGPGGSGKSTLAAAVAARLGWTCLGEDEYWIANGWGHGLRTPEQEGTVQEQVTADLLTAVRSGRGAGGVVLELILYKPPPNPLTTYQAACAAHDVRCATAVLRPSVDEILRRIEHRARPTDLGGRRTQAEWQLAVLDRCDLSTATVIDPIATPLDALVDRCLAGFDLQP